MSIDELDSAEPFFTVKLVEDEREIIVQGKTITLNLAERPICIQD